MVECPALDLRFASGREAARLEALLYATLDDFEPIAIQEHGTADGWLVFFGDQRSRDAAGAALAGLPSLLSVHPVTVPDDDWARRSQASLTAVTIGRITVAPPWDPVAQTALEGREAFPSVPVPDRGFRNAEPEARDPGSPIADPGQRRIVLVIDPSMGFGTGHHETTRLCLSLLQEIDIAGRRVVDIGTGSGVLALAAWRLGAGSVVAIDNDPAALQNARENIARNGAPSIIVEGAGLQDFVTDPADVVTANLTAALLAGQGSALRRTLKPGGTLIASGFSPAELPGVLTALGGTANRTMTEGDWVAALISVDRTHTTSTRDGKERSTLD